MITEKSVIFKCQVIKIPSKLWKKAWNPKEVENQITMLNFKS